MRGYGANTYRQSRRRINAVCTAFAFVLAVFALPSFSQSTKDQSAGVPSANDLAERVQKLTNAMARTESQLEESQHELEQMRGELAELLHELHPGAPLPESGAASVEPAQVSAEPSASALSAAVEDLREREDVAASQIATQEQAKVESVSKYPLRLHGLVLFNAFVNTSRVDQAVTPAIALGGAGSSGATMRQTILGLDATGPHLFGAQSYADLDMDFAASDGSSYAVSLARLRTAHAGLRWGDTSSTNTEAWFALDRSLLSLLTPSSLTDVSQPALSWSGNLWTWNPQFGATRQFALNESSNLRLQAALMDVGDAPYTSTSNSTAGLISEPTTAEQSRWPGMEARVSLLAPDHNDRGNMLGVGGYVAPHRAQGFQYDAWATSIDGRLRLPAGFELSGNLYRGLALGGLGGGAYKDYAYYEDSTTGEYYFRPLDDIGGWAQLKEKPTERLEFNVAFGTDQIIAHQFRPYATGTSIAQNLVANRSFTGNVIFRPSAWFLFSLEYRYLQSTPANGATAASNIIGAAAGYSF